MANGEKQETTEFSAKVPVEEYREFSENFPQYGATTWFIKSALASFNKQIREMPGFKDVVNTSIERMLEENRTVILSVD